MGKSSLAGKKDTGVAPSTKKPFKLSKDNQIIIERLTDLN